MTARSLIFLTLILTLTLALACAPARGGDDPWASLRALPESVDAAVVVNDAPAHLESPQGRAVGWFLRGAGVFDETGDAWGALADTLGLPRDEAVGALLGRRVVAAVDFEPAGVVGLPSGFTWALVTEVEPKVAKSVRTRLGAAPRRTVAGVPVLAVEDGRVQLAVIPGRGGALPTLFVASRDASALLDTLVESRVRKRAALSDDARAQAAASLGEGSITGYLRTHALDPEAPTQGPGSLMAWSAERTAGGWRAEVLTAEEPAACAPSRVTPETYHALVGDAVFAVFVTDGPAFVQGAGAVFDPTPLAMADERELLTGPVLMALRPAVIAPGAPTPPDVFTRGAFSIQVIAGIDADSGARRVDDMMAEYLVPFAPGGVTTPGERRLRSFEGSLPGVPRVQPVRLSAGFGLSRLVGREAAMSWRYAHTPGDAFAVVTCAHDNGGRGVSPATAVTAQAAGVLEGVEAGQHADRHAGNPGSLIFAGTLRPGAFADALIRAQTVPPSAALRHLGWIREVTWEFHADPADHTARDASPAAAWIPVHGTVEITTAVEHVEDALPGISEPGPDGTPGTIPEPPRSAFPERKR